MQVTIEHAPLLKMLGHVQSIVENRPHDPILGNILIDVVDGHLSLTSTDNVLTVVGRVPAEVVSEGATTISAHTLYDIIKKLPAGRPVQFVVAEGEQQIKIKSGRSMFRLPTLPTEGFPKYRVPPLPNKFSIKVEDLRNLIDKTKFAMGNEAARSIMASIYLHAAIVDGEDVLRTVSTDGKRLARFDIDLPEGAENMPNVIVSRKTVGELRKLIGEAEDSVEISLSSNNICFAFESIILYSKLVDGIYPSYEHIIPTNNDKTLKINSKDLTGALDRVSTISDNTRSVTMSLKAGRVNIRTSNKNAGEATEDIEADYEGKELTLGFNADFLMDVTRQIDDDNVEISFLDEASVSILKNESNDQALYLVMPMRI